jgi:hydroxymethylpyrimidine/phosphomethylpyrimidine kinase
LVLAGYDQSAGAGVLADAKTLEAHGVYGYAVCTGFTFQNERRIHKIQWFSEGDISEQIDMCFQSAHFAWAKIGITRSAGMMQYIIQCLRGQHPGIRIVWDPVLRSGAGTNFWEGIDPAVFEALVLQVYLLTPNWDEMGWLYPGQDPLESARRLSAHCHVYLKGGHDPVHPGRDYLFSQGECRILEPAVRTVWPKHGSGCVLSASLAANLSLGYGLPVAAVRSKRYIEQFLVSNTSLLGWHQPS